MTRPITGILLRVSDDFELGPEFGSREPVEIHGSRMTADQALDRVRSVERAMAAEAAVAADADAATGVHDHDDRVYKMTDEERVATRADTDDAIGAMEWKEGPAGELHVASVADGPLHDCGAEWRFMPFDMDARDQADA